MTARQPANMEVAVATGPSGGCGTSNLWAGTVQVAQLGDRYTLPIPRAALFGKQVFAASFNEAGALTSLGYNKDSGAARCSQLCRQAQRPCKRPRPSKLRSSRLKPMSSLLNSASLAAEPTRRIASEPQKALGTAVRATLLSRKALGTAVGGAVLALAGYGVGRYQERAADKHDTPLAVPSNSEVALTGRRG